MSSPIEHERGEETALQLSLKKEWLVRGHLVNHTMRRLTFTEEKENKIWVGKMVTDFPNPFIPVDGTFCMDPAPDGTGVEAAVLYSGQNKAGIECAWLLGFLIAKDGAVKQVYVVCGDKSRFNIDWDEIKSDIEAGKSYGSYQDEDTETYISATISVDPTSGNYSVAAIYGVA